MTASRANIGWAILVSLVLFAAPALGKDKAYFRSTWIVEPQPIDDVAKPYRPGDVLSEARLLPSNPIVLDDAITNGNNVLPAGTELFGLRTDPHAACAYTFDDPTTLKRIFVSNRQTYRCFLDQDGDGRFEAEFTLSSVYVGVPLAYGKIPSTLRPISPARYSPGKPTANKDYPRLLIKYDHRDQITGRAYLGLCITSRFNRRQPCFDPFQGIKAGEKKSLDFAGAVIDVTGEQDQVVEAKVTRPFREGSFSVTETFQIVFY